MLFYANSFVLIIDRETLKLLHSYIVNTIRGNETTNQTTMKNFPNFREEGEESR
jgi:hypothetical protein